MRLSANFTLEELTRSATAKAKGIDQTPSLDALANLRRLAVELEKVRALTGKPLKIHSGYRSPELNAAVGGAKQSFHLVGCAADFDPPSSWTHDQLQQAIGADPSIHFDLCLEEKARDGAHWLHFQVSRDGSVGRRLLKDAELDRQGGAISRITAG